MGWFFSFLVFMVMGIIIGIHKVKENQEQRYRELEDKKRKSWEATYEEERQKDIKFNKLVTCPKCNGCKLCIIKSEKKYYTEEPAHTKLSYLSYESNKKFDGDRGTRQDGFISWGYEKKTCPFCKGSGKVYAYFQDNRCFIRAMQGLEEMRASLGYGYNSSLSNDFEYEFDIVITPELKKSASERTFHPVECNSI